MEDRSYNPNGKKEEPADPTKRFMQSNESFIHFLLRKREQDAAESLEEDDDDEDEKEKKDSKLNNKRFSRLFSNLFKNEVIKQSPSSGLESSSLFGLGAAIVASEAHSQDTETQTANQPESTVDYQLPAKLDAIDKVSETTDVPSETVETPTDELEQSQRLPVETQQVVIPRINTQESINPTRNEALRANSTEYAAGDHSVDKETVIEKGVGSALPIVLVGAEYFARKRADRKLDKNFTEKTTELKQELSRGAQANQELEKLVRHNRTEVEALKQKRDTLVNPRFSEKPVDLARERYNSSGDSKLNSEDVKESQRAYSQQEKTAMPERINNGVDQIYNRDEFREPETQQSERLQELRHEVKDDQTFVAASSLGSLIEHSAAAQNLRIKQNSTLKVPDQSNSSTLTDDQAAKQYQQAIQSGFIAAVVIIIVGILAYLVIQ